MIGNKRFRKTVRRAFGWMMAGYLSAILVVTAVGSVSIGLLAVPESADAITVCDIGGACFTRDACLQTEGNEFVECGGGKVTCPQGQGCSKCKVGEGYCYPPSKPIELSIHIGSQASVLDISQYLSYVYDYAISIAGGLAGVMLMIGGFQYLTAGGDASRVGAAKKRITDSLIGLVLVLGAYMILSTINPQLVKMNEIRVPMVQKQTFIACNDFLGQMPCGQPFNLTPKTGVTDSALPKDKYTPVKAEGDTGQCIGMGCSKKVLPGLNAGDSWYKCRESDHALSAPKEGYPVPPYWCETCKKFEEDCTTEGQSDECCTGFCADGECRTGELGDKCEKDGACKSGICVDGFCGSGSAGSPCKEQGDCKVGTCTGEDLCLEPIVGGICEDNSDCPYNNCIDNIGIGTGDRCADQSGSLPTCKVDSDCPGDMKCTGPLGRESYCAEGTMGSPCTGDYNCQTGFKCVRVDNESLCSDGQVGSPCSGGAIGDSQCASRHCFESADFWWGSGFCTAGSLWSGCDSQNDCDPSQYKCDMDNHRCIYKE